MNPTFAAVGATVVVSTPMGSVTATVTQVSPPQMLVSGGGDWQGSTGLVNSDSVLFTLPVGYTNYLFFIHPYDIPNQNGAIALPVSTVTLSATPPVVTRNITGSVGDNGSVSPAPGDTFTPGESLSFTFSPANNYRVASATVDGVDVTAEARTGSYNYGAGPDHDVDVQVTFESLMLNVTLRLTVTPPEGCPPGMRIKAKAFQGDLVVPGVGLLAIWNDTKAAITQTTTSAYNPFNAGLLIGTDPGWIGNRVTRATLTGATGYGDITERTMDNIFIPNTAFTPGTDVTVDVTMSTDVLCEPNTINPPPAKDGGNHDCPPGTVWSGTACVAVSNETGGGHPCPPGYVWNGTACVLIPDNPFVPDPITPDPINPDPINPDPVDPDPQPDPISDSTKGRIHITTYLEFGLYHMSATVDGNAVGQTPVWTAEIAPGSYTVAVTDGTLSGSRVVTVVAGSTTECRFDFFSTDESTTNGLRVRAIYGDSYLVVPFTLTDPSSATSDQVTPYASADGIATGTWSASTTWRGSTITASGVVAATGVTTLLLVLPGWNETILGEEDLLPKDIPDVFQVRWRDEYGPWSPWLKIDLGKQGADEPFRWLSPMGIYRHRQYEFMATGPSPLVVPWVEEDVTKLDGGGE